LTKEPKTYVEEKTASLTNSAEKTWTSTCRRLKLDPSVLSCSIQGGKDLNVRSETENTAEKIWKEVEHIGIQQLRKRLINGTASN
jgi:hypothetical protein